MLEFVAICLNELNEVNECWIEHNSFGDIYNEIFETVNMTLTRLGYEFTFEFFEDKRCYFIKLTL